MVTATSHHRIVIVGGGDAGLSVAARLLRAGERDVAVVEPSDVHYYQPLWTLVGGGRAPVAASARTELSVMPKAATWIKERAVSIDPKAQTVGLGSGSSIGYEFLVVCPGLALDWDRLPGSSETLGRAGASSNYGVDLAPKTWEMIRSMRRGTAVFTMPSGPIKCAGAPQFALGDAGSSPNSKTGAAIRKQAPVVVDNLRAVMAGREPSSVYDGYASCPLTTARNRMLLAEFDYTMKPHPTIPVIDTKKERYDMWLLMRYGLPWMYWNLILKGLA